MIEKSRKKGMGFLKAGFYFQDQYVCQCAAKNPVDIGSY